MRGNKKTLLIIGLTLVFFALSTPVKAETLCSYEGPDVSEDLLRLTNFVVSGPSSLKEGDTITVKFDIQNYGQSDLNLGTKGIFVGSLDPDNLDTAFGFTRANTILKVGETVSIKVSQVLDKAGTWVIWPSYHLSLQTGEKLGPEKWHDCPLVVSEAIQDSDQDGITDEKDNCPLKYNPEQEDVDNDGIGNVCDPCDDRDFDQDGIKNCLDQCPEKPETFNDYQDEDGCPDEVEITAAKLNMKVTPSYPKKGENFNVRVTSDSNILSQIVILINGVQVKKCLNSPCDFIGTAIADDLDIGAISMETTGTIASIGSIFWEEPCVCCDSDEGIAPYAPGRVTNESARREDDTIYLPPTYFDTCINSTHIREYYCNGSSVESVIRRCRGCVESPEDIATGRPIRGDWCPCDDSDGRNYFSRGLIGTSSGVISDYCLDSNSVVEFYCDEDNEPANVTVQCEYTRVPSTGAPPYTRASGCIEGACPCEDSDGGINYYERGIVPSTDFPWGQDDCITEGVHGELREYYTSIEVDHWDPTGNPVYRCYIRDEEYTCEGDCIDGECVPTCYDGVRNQGEEGVDCGGPCRPCIPRIYPCTVTLPDQFDWRNYGILPGIRDQAACGSCWAFSAIGAMEARYNLERLMNSTPPDIAVDLSEQSLVSDCMSGCCKGGWPHEAFDYIGNSGVVDEACLPYQSQICINTTSSSCFPACDCGGGRCSNPCSCNARCINWNTRLWSLERYVRVSSNIDEIKNALICYGPLSVSSDNWHHAILIVGYNDASGNWTIRNSWGPGWGSGGYGEIPYSGHLYSDIKDRVYYVERITSPP